MLNVDGKKKEGVPSRIVCIPRAFAAFRFLDSAWIRIVREASNGAG